MVNEATMQFVPIRLMSDQTWCIGLAQPYCQDRVNVCLQRYTGDDSQLWCLDDFGLIRNRIDINFVMDVQSSRWRRGTNVWLYQKNQTTAQQWKYVNNEIMPIHHQNFRLDLNGNKRSPGNNVHIYDRNGTSAQRWVMDFSHKKIGSRTAAARTAKTKKAEAARKAEFKKADAERYARKHPVDMLFEHCPQTHVYDEYRMIFKQEGVDMHTIKKGLGPYYSGLGVRTGLHRDQIDHGVEKLMIKLKEMGL